MSTSVLTRLTHTGQKFSEKNFCKGVQPYFEISLLSFIHKIFEHNFCEYLAVYCWWTYKNADEKANTFLRRSKKVKKWTKTGEKRYSVNSPLLILGSKFSEPSLFFVFNGLICFGPRAQQTLDRIKSEVNFLDRPNWSQHCLRIITVMTFIWKDRY